jgi:hypothetical protein
MCKYNRLPLRSNIFKYIHIFARLSSFFPSQAARQSRNIYRAYSSGAGGATAVSELESRIFGRFTRSTSVEQVERVIRRNAGLFAKTQEIGQTTSDDFEARAVCPSGSAAVGPASPTRRIESGAGQAAQARKLARSAPAGPESRTPVAGWRSDAPRLSTAGAPFRHVQPVTGRE